MEDRGGLGELRSLVQQRAPLLPRLRSSDPIRRATLTRWRDLLAALTASLNASRPRARWHEEALPYVTRAIESWPALTRPMPRVWLHQIFHGGNVSASAGLARMIDWRGASTHTTHLAKLAAHQASLRSINILDISYAGMCSLHPNIFAPLLEWESLALDTLIMEGASRIQRALAGALREGMLPRLKHLYLDAAPRHGDSEPLVAAVASRPIQTLSLKGKGRHQLYDWELGMWCEALDDLGELRALLVNPHSADTSINPLLSHRRLAQLRVLEFDTPRSRGDDSPIVRRLAKRDDLAFEALGLSVTPEERLGRLWASEACRELRELSLNVAGEVTLRELSSSRIWPQLVHLSLQPVHPRLLLSAPAPATLRTLLIRSYQEALPSSAAPLFSELERWSGLTYHPTGGHEDRWVAVFA